MRTPRVALGLLLVAAATRGAVIGQAQAPAAGPTFDVVSIKPSPPQTGPTFRLNVLTQRPDGGVTIAQTPVALLITRAHPGTNVADMVGLPAWASREFYDISATASMPSPTNDDRMAMMRAMLADRFRLLAHSERREVPTFDLVLARDDGKLGPGLAPSDVDCEALAAARRAAVEAARQNGAPPPPPAPFDPNAPPPCAMSGTPTGFKGDMTIDALASMLRGPSGRLVMNKTGLRGTYRLNLTFASALGAGGLDVAPSPDDGPSVFTAVQEQLGLKLDPSRTQRDVLVIDRLERPTEN